MWCHNAYAVTGLEYAQRYVRMRADDVLYTCLPLFHSNAQAITTMPSLLSGRPMVMTSRFSASGFLDEIRSHGATVFNYIGAMLTISAQAARACGRRRQPASADRRQLGAARAVDRFRAPLRHRDRGDLRADGDGGRVPGQPARRRAHREVRGSGELVGGPDPARRRHRGRAGRAGRVRRTHRAAQRHVRRLLQEPGRDGARRWPAAGSFRRPRPALGGRVLRVHRPAEGLDSPPRREHLLLRGRAGGERASGSGRERGGGGAVGARRGGRDGGRGTARGRRARPGRARRLLHRARGGVHGAALREDPDTLPKTPTQKVQKFALREAGVGSAWDRLTPGEAR